MPNLPRVIKSPTVLDSDWIYGEIASGIDLQSTPQEELKRGEQWKIWLDTGQKTALDLIKELENAPGKPAPGKPISESPVPYYKPGPVQLQAHEAKEPFILVAGGVRGGKSKWLAAELLPWMFKSYAHLWILGPEFWFALDEFRYIRWWLEWLDVPIIRISTPQDGRQSITTKWGAVLETMTGKEAESIEMANLNAAAIAEAGHVDKIILSRVQQRVFQKGGPIYLSGTLDEAQPWYINALKQYKNGDPNGNWRSFSIPSWDNLAAFPLGEQDEKVQRLKQELSEDEFARRVAAIPQAPEGLVFKEFNDDTHVVPMKFVEVPDGHLTEYLQKAYGPFQAVNLEPGLSATHATVVGVKTTSGNIEWPSQKLGNRAPIIAPTPVMNANGFKIDGWEIPDLTEVQLAIDPGWEPGRYAVLACVIQRDTVLVFDEIYESKMDGESIIQMCKDRPWWPKVRSGVIDTASKQHHEGMSEHEKWAKYGGLRLLTQYVPVADGIARFRNFLVSPSNGRPRLYISPVCDNLIWEFGQYRYPRVRNPEERNVRELPIDNHNHALKALTYFLVVKFDFTDSGQMKTTSKRYIEKRARNVAPTTFRWDSDDMYRTGY